MKFFKIKSYAKINLSLNITKKISSKFNQIESLVSFINLYDLIYLRFISSNSHKIYFKGQFAKGISKKNTVSKLLQILDRKKFA
jgi:4-diphosphocytidyl-2-C-methyl-D-erythritol kinase